MLERVLGTTVRCVHHTTVIFMDEVPDENWRFVDVDESSLKRVDETLGCFVGTGDGRRPVKTDKLPGNRNFLVDDHLK